MYIYILEYHGNVKYLLSKEVNNKISPTNRFLIFIIPPDTEKNTTKRSNKTLAWPHEVNARMKSRRIVLRRIFNSTVN